MALRETQCMLRKVEPERAAAILQQAGIEVEQGELGCLANLDANWSDCPLFRRAE
jgi:hypothetical protein